MPKLNVQQNNQNIIQAFRNALAIGNLKGIIASDGNHNFSTSGSNPNLLDNAYFVGGGSQLGDGVFPINQRGQTSYTGASATGVDRWWQQYNTNVQLTSAGLRITGDWDIQQRFARPLPNGTYTLSVDVASKGDTTPLMMTINASYQQIGSSQITQNGINTFTFTSDSSNPVQGVAISLAAQAGADLTIRDVKLEKGTVSTLANDVPPDFGTELAKCQRYLFIRDYVQTDLIGHGLCVSATFGIINVTLPVSMRSGGSPTGTFSASPLVYGGGTGEQPSLALNTVVGNTAKFVASMTAGIANTAIVAYAGTNIRLVISNEL